MIANYVEIFPKKKYFLKQTLEELMKNNYLSTGGNIFGIFQVINFCIQKNTPKVIEDLNLLKIIIPIEHPIIKDISFTLIEEKKDINSQLNEISDIIYNNLINRISILEKENQELKKKNDENEKVLKNLEEKEKKFKEEYEKRLNNLENKINNLIITPQKIFDSKININEQLIKLWLNNRIFTSELLYRKSRDGSKPINFHNKCDNKGTTITFIETIKGYIFGGYTELDWDNSGYKKDNSTFIFSLNKEKKYTARNNENSIKCSNNEGPRFGSLSHPEIFLFNSLDKGRSFHDINKNTFVTNRELTNGEEFWDVKEIEVFKIKYNG